MVHLRAFCLSWLTIGDTGYRSAYEILRVQKLFCNLGTARSAESVASESTRGPRDIVTVRSQAGTGWTVWRSQISLGNSATSSPFEGCPAPRIWVWVGLGFVLCYWKSVSFGGARMLVFWSEKRSLVWPAKLGCISQYQMKPGSESNAVPEIWENRPGKPRSTWQLIHKGFQRRWSVDPCNAPVTFPNFRTGNQISAPCQRNPPSPSGW